MSIIWINKPKRVYIIETDQKTFRVETEFLNYKNTVISLKKQGYTNIHINYIGYAMHNNY